MRKCGPCGMCCKLLGVPGVTEPGCRCPHWSFGKGCAIYRKRPDPCRNFACTWLLSDPALMSESLRPDRCGVVMWTENGTKRLVVHIDERKPEAWERQDVQAVVRFWLAGERQHVLKLIGDQVELISNRPLSEAEARRLAA